MFRSTAKHGRTILQFAARSGSKEGFEAAVIAVKQALTATEVNLPNLLYRRITVLLHFVLLAVENAFTSSSP